MTCPACHSAATNWRSGSVQADCRGCDVRETAQAPRMHRDSRYKAIRDSHGSVVLDQFRADVNAEFKRIQTLKLQENA
jgi:hypothetical protein